MPQPNSNIVTTPQSGLISTNPFLNMGVPKTSGTTTPLVGGTSTTVKPNPNSGWLSGQPGALGSAVAAANGSLQTQPVTSSINFSGLLPTPNSGPQTSVLPKGQTNFSGVNSSGVGLSPASSLPAGYATPGQSYAQYEASQGFPQSGQPATSRAGGGQAPPGMEYNGQGQLVPIDNSQTVNGQGQNTSIPTNVATGGGTQTNFPSIVGGLASTAATSSPQFQAAEQQYLSANQNLEQLRSDAAQQNANILGSRTNLAEAGGEQGLLQNLEAGKESALTGEMTAAQAAAEAATGQQGTQQSGLASAGELTSPQGANALGTYNPLTGQYSQYGGGTGGGAASAGAVGAQVQQGGQIQTMIGQQSQAKALAGNLSSLIDSAGINPNNASVFTGFLNGVNKWINTQSGDPQYQNFANLLNEISSRYASILNQSGGTPTDQSTISHSIINGLASGQSIEQVLGSLDKNATDSINALKSSSQSNAVSGGGSASSVSAGGYTYVQQNGKWVVKQ